MTVMPSCSDSITAPAIALSMDEMAIAILAPLVEVETFYGARDVRAVLLEALDALGWVAAFGGGELLKAQAVIALLISCTPAYERPRTLRLVKGGES
jgi:hypothetical protein